MGGQLGNRGRTILVLDVLELDVDAGHRSAGGVGGCADTDMLVLLEDVLVQLVEELDAESIEIRVLDVLELDVGPVRGGIEGAGGCAGTVGRGRGA